MKKSLILNIKDNELIGNIDDIASRTGETLLNAYDIIVSSCVFIRKIFHTLQDRYKDFSNIIEKDSLSFISPVMDVQLHPETLAIQIQNIFKQLDPQSGFLFDTKFDFNKLPRKGDIYENLMFSSAEIFNNTAKQVEYYSVGKQIKELKLKLNELEKVWDDNNFKKIKSTLIKDCNLAHRKAKGYIDYVTEMMEKYLIELKM